MKTSVQPLCFPEDMFIYTTSKALLLRPEFFHVPRNLDALHSHLDELEHVGVGGTAFAASTETYLSRYACFQQLQFPCTPFRQPSLDDPTRKFVTHSSTSPPADGYSILGSAALVMRRHDLPQRQHQPARPSRVPR